jgi:murein DD-endopeptidase MepM/ murein hydrolase activator NlpD
MIDFSDTNDGTAVCAVCAGFLAGGRYALLEGWSVRLLCSEACFGAAVRERSKRRWAVRRRNAKRVAIALALVGTCLTPHEGPFRPARSKRAASVSSARVPGPPPLPAGWFGPDWPPTEMSVLATLGRDAWIHPLAGPVRRMPLRDTRVFGAVRPGDRAVECRNGHCGVDLGGEIWGEHVHAVHDGQVDYVQRGANPERGGLFVRLSHHNGTVFTQYFHLAAIPRGLERGMAVKSGDVIGLLGDSGVKESEPHLHFAISIRPWKERPEKYVDPEPLIALWPLRVPLDGSEVGLVTTLARPGVPLGSAPLLAGRKRKLAKLKRAAAASASGDGGGPATTNPESDEATAPPATPESATGE